MNISNGWTLGPGSSLRFSSPQISRLNGNQVTLADEVIVGLQANARINADAVLTNSANVALYKEANLEFQGTTQVEGGSYSIDQDARLAFSGPTTILGGSFTTTGNSLADGYVEFSGPTTWRGGASINGVAVQSGDASVTLQTTIQAGIFDFDGYFGTAAWQITQPLTISADAVDISDNKFDGVLNLSGLLGSLTVNLTDPGQAWRITNARISLGCLWHH